MHALRLLSIACALGALLNPSEARAELSEAERIRMFHQAGKAHYRGDHKKAERLYTSALKGDSFSAEAAFNLARTQTKLENYAVARLWLTRAQRFGSSSQKEATDQALEYVDAKLEDGRGSLKRTQPSLLYRAWLHLPKANLLGYLLLASMFLAFGGLTVLLFVRSPTTRLSMGLLSSVSAVLSLIFASLLFLRLGWGLPGKPAILVEETPSLLGGPDRRAPRAGRLEAGDVVYLKRYQAEFAQIENAGGKTGWVLRNEVRAIEERD